MSIPVFLASDDIYAPFVATVIASVCTNTNAQIDFYVIDSGISNTNKKKLNELKSTFPNFTIEYLKAQNLHLPEFKGSLSYITSASYSRFLIPDLKPNIKRAIYLDVDVIAMGDISLLWNQKLNDHTVGWIRNVFFSPGLLNFMREFNLVNYYNSGVLLIDTERWRQNNYTEKLLKLAKKLSNKLHFFDQDLMNLVFQDDSVALNPKFNVQYTAPQIVIRHFITSCKPWKTKLIATPQGWTQLPNFDDFWHYISMTPFYEK